jgi:para-nitrobenzyl esterase
MDSWIAFARTGDPAHAGLPEWPAYDTAKRATLVFDRRCELANAPLDPERAAWDAIL